MICGGLSAIYCLEWWKKSRKPREVILRCWGDDNKNNKGRVENDQSPRVSYRTRINRDPDEPINWVRVSLKTTVLGIKNWQGFSKERFSSKTNFFQHEGFGYGLVVAPRAEISRLRFCGFERMTGRVKNDRVPIVSSFVSHSHLLRPWWARKLTNRVSLETTVLGTTNWSIFPKERFRAQKLIFSNMTDLHMVWWLRPLSRSADCDSAGVMERVWTMRATSAATLTRNYLRVRNAARSDR